MKKVEFKKKTKKQKPNKQKTEWNQQGTVHILILLCLPETPLTRPESPGAPSYSLPHSLPQRQVCGLAGSYKD